MPTGFHRQPDAPRVVGPLGDRVSTQAAARLGGTNEAPVLHGNSRPWAALISFGIVVTAVGGSLFVLLIGVISLVAVAITPVIRWIINQPLWTW